MLRRGYTTIEFLIALIVSSVLIPLVFTSLRLLISHQYFNQEAQDEIALYQLRKILLLVNHISISDTILEGFLNEEEIRLVYDNRHVYLQPGTQIFLTDIDDGYFSIEGNLCFFNYYRDKTWTKRVLINV